MGEAKYKNKKIKGALKSLKNSKKMKELESASNTAFKKYFDFENKEELVSKIAALKILDIISEKPEELEAPNMQSYFTMIDEAYQNYLISDSYRDALKEYAQNKFVGEVNSHGGDILSQDLGNPA